MARRKRAPALFEVIHKDKRFARNTDRGGLRTPSWWFKRGPKPAATQPPIEGEQTAPGLRQAPTSTSAGDTSSQIPGETAAGQLAQSLASHQSKSTTPRSLVPPITNATVSPIVSPSPLVIDADTDAQQITFKLTYTSAGIVGFAVIVAVGLIFIAGRRLSHGPDGAFANTTEEIRKQPAKPEVLHPDRSATSPRPNGIIVKQPDRTAGAGTTIPSPGPIQPATAYAGAVQRVVNHNYLIVQSYPDEKMAQDASDFLKSRGVQTTVETGLKGWGPRWFVVVGTEGFSRISTPDAIKYRDGITELGQEYASKNPRSFKAFQPTFYRWDKTGS